MEKKSRIIICTYHLKSNNMGVSCNTDFPKFGAGGFRGKNFGGRPRRYWITHYVTNRLSRCGRNHYVTWRHVIDIYFWQFRWSIWLGQYIGYLWPMESLDCESYYQDLTIRRSLPVRGATGSLELLWVNKDCNVKLAYILSPDSICVGRWL